jgi:hypothetical protein
MFCESTVQLFGNGAGELTNPGVLFTSCIPNCCVSCANGNVGVGTTEQLFFLTSARSLYSNGNVGIGTTKSFFYFFCFLLFFLVDTICNSCLYIGVLNRGDKNEYDTSKD